MDKSGVFIGVERFFGILVPGAILLFLDGEMFLKPFSSQLGSDSMQGYAAFVASAYVVGHLLIPIGIPLNRFLNVVHPPHRDSSFLEVKGRIPLPAERRDSRVASFHRAYCFIQLRSPAAIETVQRHIGDFKLFRSLALVFAIDSVTTAVDGGAGWFRPLLAAALSALTLSRYYSVLDWTYRITFEYYAVLTTTTPGTLSPSPAVSPVATTDAVILPTATS